MGTNAVPDAEAAIRRFLAGARQPVLLEPGEEQFPLNESAYALEWRGTRLVIQAWDERRNLVRRITGVRDDRPGRLELAIERFGGEQGHIFLYDLGRVSAAGTRRRGERLVWREDFRRALARQFPGWRIAEISAEPNLEESLSPAYPRAFLRKGTSAWAAISSPPEPGAAAGAVTFGLIWLDYLRRRERKLAVEGLAFFLPQQQTREACLRVRFLNPSAAQFQVFVYTAQGYEDRVDPADSGNLATKLEAASTRVLEPPPFVAAAIERLTAMPFVEAIPRNDGAVSLRVRGLEFARATQEGVVFGLERKFSLGQSNLPEAEALAREIARLRSPGAYHKENPLWRLQPEAWLESQVRAHFNEIDASLYASPVYGQVAEATGGDRGIIDLVAAGRDGRLAVIELKASEDIHLPLQALDYWIRVRWHASRDEFSEKGYFPGIALRRDPPRLLLVAPAFGFHPKTETLLRYFSPEIEVERIGLGVEWRQRPRVMFRIRGAQQPF